MASDLIDWVKKYEIPIRNIVHIGSHLVQEREDYNTLGAKHVYWIEAMPWVAEQAISLLKNYPNQSLVCGLLWSSPGEKREFFIAGNEGSSSSTLKPFLISASHPEVRISRSVFLETTTLDLVIKSAKPDLGSGNFLVVDTQGAELHIIQGALDSLSRFDYIVAEVSLKELYLGATSFQKFSKEMKKFGYSLVDADINRATGWGDALYFKDEIFFESGHLPTISYSGRHFGVRTLFRAILLRLKDRIGV